MRFVKYLEMLEILKEAKRQLEEHNNEYHHKTPKEFLDRIQKFLDDEKGQL